MKSKIIMFLLAGALLCACQKEEFNNNSVDIKPFENGGEYVLEADTVIVDKINPIKK